MPRSLFRRWLRWWLSKLIVLFRDLTFNSRMYITYITFWVGEKQKIFVHVLFWAFHIFILKFWFLVIVVSFMLCWYYFNYGSARRHSYFNIMVMNKIVRSSNFYGILCTSNAGVSPCINLTSLSLSIGKVQLSRYYKANCVILISLTMCSYYRRFWHFCSSYSHNQHQEELLPS